MGPSWRRAVAPAVLLLAATLLAGSSNLGIFSVASADEAPVLVVTGDIDGCHRGDETAELVAATTGPIATVGDNAYPDGTASEYSRCYDRTWGKFNARVRPVPGNHDYDTAKAKPYFDYFGAAAAGVTGGGWYSYDVGTWHVVALNSNCDDVDCGEQAEWLEQDLVAHPSACIAAYWHHPRFASGSSGGDSAVAPFWKVLYAHGATVILNGHDHDYERFAPMDPSGRRDPNRGMRQFIVGTGGATLGSFGSAAPNSEVRNNDSYGILKLTLHPDGYDWRFVPIDDDKFTDSGHDTCKGTAPAPAPAPPPASAAPAPGDGSAGGAPPVVEPDAAPANPDPQASSTPTTRNSRRSVPNFDQPSRPAPKATSPPVRPSVTTRATPRATAPPAPPSSVPPATQAPPPPEPAGAPPEAPPAVPPAPGKASVLGTSVSASYAPGDDAPGDDLSLAIAGLIRPSGDHHPDRRGLALVALTLLAADAAALTALRRGQGKLRAS